MIAMIFETAKINKSQIDIGPHDKGFFIELLYLLFLFFYLYIIYLIVRTFFVSLVNWLTYGQIMNGDNNGGEGEWLISWFIMLQRFPDTDLSTFSMFNITKGFSIIIFSNEHHLEVTESNTMLFNLLNNIQNTVEVVPHFLLFNINKERGLRGVVRSNYIVVKSLLVQTGMCISRIIISISTHFEGHVDYYSPVYILIIYDTNLVDRSSDMQV
ncbi:hypothetical protein ACJX0J_019078 [Zea mays]